MMLFEQESNSYGLLARRMLATVLFLAVLGSLLYRITNSLELGDEVYNAAFVDDWLKGGIDSSTFLVLHQTAGLLSYPFVLIFWQITGSTDGLLLFLRFLFICGNLLAAVALYACLRKSVGNAAAFVGMLAILAFLPSGAPTTSYTSWGSQYLTIALATLGLAFNASSSRWATVWFTTSAVSWALMAIAYPTLPVATVACLFITWYSALQRTSTWRYILLVTGCLCVAALLVVWIFTLDRLIASFEFLSAFNGSGNLLKKLSFTTDVFTGNPTFCALLFLAASIGIVRRFVNDRITATLTTMLLGSLLFMPVFPSAMLTRSADAVMLATATGLGLVFDIRPAARVDDRRRVLAILYTTSLCAALVTTVTATVSIWCFMLGALPGAIIAVASFGITIDARRQATAAMLALTGVILMTSLTLYSGEWPPVQERVRITWGPAKGLAVAEWQAPLINMMRDDVNPLLSEGGTILVEGRYSGLGVLSPARTKALSTYVLRYEYTTKKAVDIVAAFYADPANRPDIVVIYEDETLQFHEAFGENLTKWYERILHKSIAAGSVKVMQKKKESNASLSGQKASRGSTRVRWGLGARST